MLPTLLAAALLSTPAHAGDKGDCRKARKQMTVEAWTGYVLDHPEGRCADEAIGQLFVLNVGKFATSITNGDRTKLALSLAQLGRSNMDELNQLAGMFGGSGLGGLGGGSMDSLWGGGDYEDYGGVLGTLDSGYGYGYGGSYAEPDPAIYVSYYVDSVDGAWNEQQFWGVLDATRPALQTCWKGLGREPMGIYFVAGFDVKEGAATVTSLVQDYSDDGAPHADVEACLRDSLSTASFPAEVTGSYTYRVELY